MQRCAYSRGLYVTPAALIEPDTQRIAALVLGELDHRTQARFIEASRCAQARVLINITRLLYPSDPRHPDRYLLEN